jgi:hypothetical protein
MSDPAGPSAQRRLGNHPRPIAAIICGWLYHLGATTGQLPQFSHSQGRRRLKPGLWPLGRSKPIKSPCRKEDRIQQGLKTAARLPPRHGHIIGMFAKCAKFFWRNLLHNQESPGLIEMTVAYKRRAWFSPNRETTWRLKPSPRRCPLFAEMANFVVKNSAPSDLIHGAI